jgi:hypothetical protein
LVEEEIQEVEIWWWKSLWRLEAPLKSKIYMWLALMDKMLT